MQISIAGSAGIGKTTLANQFSGFFGWPLIENSIRRCLKNKSLAEVRQDVRKWQYLILDYTVNEMSGQTDFIADRSVYDYIAHAIHHHTCTGEWLKGYIDKACASVDYDFVIVLPWGVLPLIADGVRIPRIWYQYEIQGLTEQLIYQLYKGNVIWINNKIKPENYFDYAKGIIINAIRNKQNRV